MKAGGWTDGPVLDKKKVSGSKDAPHGLMSQWMNFIVWEGAGSNANLKRAVSKEWQVTM